ncbi:MAG: serine/threonine protein kinase [Actinobacteria bacterium]|nr:serine/threonine protein kinase [Actinomycetota bacterium]
MTTAAAPGRVLNNRYRLVERLARGGMATVWVAEDTLLARKVAVKTLHPELSVDEGVRARFRNEAISAAGLAHPGIVTTYDTGEDDGVAYIVMELVEGPNLRTLLDERGPLPVPDALRIARGVAAALEEAHRSGIVHRDIKPANVLVPPNGPVKVTDFGIAKVSGKGDLTSAGTIVGTARYLAPEQVRGEPADGRADVYAVGLLFHEMLAGELPFHGDTEMGTALARLSMPPDPLPASIPADVKAIEARCLEQIAGARWPSAHALAAAIDAVLRGDALPPAEGDPPTRTVAPPPPAAPPTPTTTAPRPRPHARRSGRAWPWAILGGIMLGAGAVGGYLILQELDKRGGDTIDPGDAAQIVSADDFDPFADVEHPELVDNVFDNDTSSAWRTETYSTPELGGKQGVGIYVVLDSTADVSSVEVLTNQSGWDAEIYVAASPATELSGWGSPAATGTSLGTSHVFDLDESGGAVLVWLTRVPEGGRLEITEIRVG